MTNLYHVIDQAREGQEEILVRFVTKFKCSIFKRKFLFFTVFLTVASI